MEEGLVLSGIDKRLRGREVLRGASLDVAPGEILWLGGQNGAGKTTLLRIAAGLFTPDGGTVRFDTMPPGSAFRRRVGLLVAGDRGLYPRLTARQNLEFAAGASLLRGRARRAAVERALSATAITDLADRRVDRISLGQRQRVRLSMAVIHDPDLLLLDEPHTSLDDEGLAHLAQVLNASAARGATVVWASPPNESARAPAHRRVRVENGAIVDLA